MKSKHHLLLSLLAYSILGWSQQSPKVLSSLDEALTIAFEYNPDLEVYENNMKKAETEWKAARSHWLPTVSTTLTGQDNLTLPTTLVPGEIFGQPGQLVETQFGQRYAFTAGVSISKGLLDWQAHMKARMAKTDVKIQSARNEVFRQQLTQQVAHYYYGVLIAQEALRLHEEDVRLTAEVRELSRMKREQGLIDQATYNQSQILANNAKTNKMSTERLLNEYLMLLQFTLGIPLETTVELQELIGPQVFQESITEVRENKELELGRSQLEFSEWGVKLQKSADLPKLSLYSYFGQQQFRDDFGLSLSSEDWFGNSYVGLSLNVPIFSGFKIRNQVRSAKLDRDIYKEQLESSTLENQYADRILLYNYTQGQGNVTIARENFELYRETTGLSRNKYEQGLIGLDQYLVALEDQLKAENQFLNALSSLSTHYATILSRNQL